MRVLVTGCAGFIGAHTSEALLESGLEVVGVDDFSSGHPENLTRCSGMRRFRFERSNLAERDEPERVVASYRPDVVIHLAGLVDVAAAEADPALNTKLNVELTRSVTEAATRYRVRRVVFSSSAAIYGDRGKNPIGEELPAAPCNRYGAAKLECECVIRRMARFASVEAVCLRYFNVFGARQRTGPSDGGVLRAFAEKSRAGLPAIVHGDGRQTRDFIAVEDVARANLLAATRPGLDGLVANVCTGKGRSLLEVLEMMRRRYPMAPPPRFAAERPGDIRHSVGDPRLAACRLDFGASLPFEEGLQRMINFLG